MLKHLGPQLQYHLCPLHTVTRCPLCWLLLGIYTGEPLGRVSFINDATVFFSAR